MPLSTHRRSRPDVNLPPSVRRRQQLALGFAQRLLPLRIAGNRGDRAPVKLHRVADPPEAPQMVAVVDQRLVASLAIVVSADGNSSEARAVFPAKPCSSAA